MIIPQQLQVFISRNGGYLRNFGLIFLVILGLMNVVHNLTFRKPTDGAVWKQEEGRLRVVETDLNMENSFLLGDVLLRINDKEIKDKDSYEDYLYSVPIGGERLYTLQRDGNLFEPWVTIRGEHQGAGAGYYMSAVTGFVYLIFLFLILSQNVSYGSKTALVWFSGTVFLTFVFHYTLKLTLLDWISLLFTQIGSVLLPSALVSVALHQSFSRSRWLPYVQAVHWGPSILLLMFALMFYMGLLPDALGEAFFHSMQRVLGLWGGSLIILAILVLALVAEIRSKERNFTIFWALSWTPYALTSWEVNIPFAAEIAGLAPNILPVALLLDWSRKGFLYLGDLGKKVIVYFSVAFVLILGYFLFTAAFLAMLGSRNSAAGQNIILGIGTIFAAVAYSPLKHYADELLDRLVYGKRFESIKVLSDFSEINRADTNIDEFLFIIFNRIQKAFLIEHGSVYKVGENTKIFNTIDPIQEKRTFVFEELNPELLEGEIVRGSETRAFLVDVDKKAPFMTNDYVCPIRVSGKLAAMIVFSFEGNELKLSPEELRLLKSLMHQCDVLMENMELYQAVNQKAMSIMQLKEYNENIIESSRIGILTTDETGCAESCNSTVEELAGMSKGEIMGKTFDDVFQCRELTNQRRDKTGVSMEGNYHNAAGDELVLEIMKTPLRNQENEVYGTLYLVEDIREKKIFDEKLMQQEKLASIGMLAAGVAHEINTPLTGITGYSQLLVGDPSLDQEHKELLELIQAQSRRAANIVSELLNFSRKEASPKGPVDLLDVLNQTLRFLSHTIQKKKVQVTVEEPKQQAIIEGYPNPIQQVFVNLVVNAMDAMPEGGKLDISFVCRRNHVQMSFKDTGAGMDAKTRSHIFDPFFTTKEVGKGTGLGLAVVYNILQEHGASVEVFSRVGVGTSFVLQFPFKAEAAKTLWPRAYEDDDEVQPIMS